MPLHVNKLYHTCTYNSFPEDEPLGSKHVEHIIKIKISVYKRCILSVYIVQKRMFMIYLRIKLHMRATGPTY
jgi:hypothetical protein